MTATVDGSTRYQVIDGFGANLSECQLSSNNVADFLWRQDVGLGLSLMCSELYVNQTTGQGWPKYESPQDYTGVILQGDFSAELQAYARGCRRFMVRCWSPQYQSPFSWLSGGGQNGSLLSADYSNMATAFTTYLSNALAAGVPCTHVSPFNEPDITPSYPQTSWTTTQALNFVDNYLGPALVSWVSANPSWCASTGMSAVGLVWSEVSNWSALSTWTSAVEGDSVALGYVTQYSAHQYSGVASPPSPCSRPIWQTEMHDSSAWDASMTEGLVEANYVYSALTTGNATAWLHWYTEDNSDNNNSGLIGTNGSDWTNPPQALIDWNNPTLPKAAYALGHFSRFVRPGFQRISITGAPAGVNALAFQDPTSGNVAIVAINTNGSATPFSVTFSNVPAVLLVVPWTTSSSLGLSQQPTVTSISSYSLPATSVTTFMCYGSTRLARGFWV